MRNEETRGQLLRITLPIVIDENNDDIDDDTLSKRYTRRAALSLS